ncbi:phosphoheptose isomerase [Allostreptomyces psammosilenae]|uniref:Phosphoheptose isomerase n=1 Tax=Allostreptomyces psammosilenae TaxID=1892865 RepID=A0A852ZS56_9ACTN|nr:phosphoheptose isomerase [Allostreptomyces psammosilenae]
MTAHDPHASTRPTVHRTPAPDGPTTIPFTDPGVRPASAAADAVAGTDAGAGAADDTPGSRTPGHPDVPGRPDAPRPDDARGHAEPSGHAAPRGAAGWGPGAAAGIPTGPPPGGGATPGPADRAPAPAPAPEPPDPASAGPWASDGRHGQQGRHEQQEEPGRHGHHGHLRRLHASPPPTASAAPPVAAGPRTALRRLRRADGAPAAPARDGAGPSAHRRPLLAARRPPTAPAPVVPPAVPARPTTTGHLTDLAEALERFTRLAPTIDRWGACLATLLRDGGRLLAAGNGGSAAQAQHLTAELVGRYVEERRPLSAIALHADTSSCTAIANDYGVEEMFARQVGAHGRPGDVLMLLSTSGRSANLVAAAEAARAIGVQVWAMTGPRPNPLADIADEVLCTPGARTATVQELHLVAVHTLCGAIDAALGELGPGPGPGAATPPGAAAGPGATRRRPEAASADPAGTAWSGRRRHA